MSYSFDTDLNEFDPDSNYFDQYVSENHIFSTFDSVDDFYVKNASLMNDPKFISIFCQNIRSINANLDDFLLLFNENLMPDCFIFCETWHDGNQPILIPGFKGFHTVRHLRRGGGISIFVKNSLHTEVIEELCFTNETIEINTVKISNNVSHIFMCGIYRPHSGTIENFSNAVENILENRLLNNCNTVLLGDLNINLASNGGEADCFVNMMRAHHFLQTISDITHPATNHSAPSLLDHIWINAITNFNSGLIRSGITDHHTTFIHLPFNCRSDNSEKIKLLFRDCSDENKIIFENKLRDFHWENIKSVNPDLFVQFFLSNLNQIYQDSFPLKTKYVTQKYFNNPWHNKDVKKLSNARRNYHKLYLLKLVSWDQYAAFRNKITNLIRKCKEKYYAETFSRNFGNAKKNLGNYKRIMQWEY